jgi:hypothetical protein
MKERQFTSMAQQRRFERQQNEIEKIRQAKAAKNVDGKTESTDDGASGDEA